MGPMDGHRAEWRVAATESATSFAAARATGAEVSAAPGRAPATPAAPASAADLVPTTTVVAAASDASSAELATLIERAVARQVRPLREELAQAQAQAQAGLRDVLGGLGYIAGLAGLGLWWQQRRRARGDLPPAPSPPGSDISAKDEVATGDARPSAQVRSR